MPAGMTAVSCDRVRYQRRCYSSERPGWVWTTSAIVLTRFLVWAREREKRAYGGVSGRRVGGPTEKRERNGKGQNARNHGHMGSWRRSYAVSQLRGTRCG